MDYTEASVCLFVYLFVCVSALCPEEAESALEATHFFTEDEPRGKHIDKYCKRLTYCSISTTTTTTVVHTCILSTLLTGDLLVLVCTSGQHHRCKHCFGLEDTDLQ